MTEVKASTATADLSLGQRARAARRAERAQARPGVTALVPVSRPREVVSFQRVRPQAGFLAQLIACASDVPLFRTRRRAAPQEAQAAYEAKLEYAASLDKIA